MIEFRLPAMSCGHCEGAVKEAAQQVDPQAHVKVDLATKQVQVESAHVRDEFARAFTEAGYPPA